MTHYYDKGEWKFPSVTTIISDCTDKSGALTGWAVNCYRNYMEDAIVGLEKTNTAVIPFGYLRELLDTGKTNYKDIGQTALDVGSEVHGMIERYLKDEPVVFTENTPDQVQSAFQAFRQWEKEHDLRPMAIEQTVYGDYWAGTLDFKGLFNGKGYIIDWKSSKAHYPEMRYQVAAYRSTQEPLSDLIIEGCGVLRLDKETGLPDWKDTSKTYEKDLQIFSAMKQLYFLRHPRIARKAGWKG